MRPSPGCRRDLRRQTGLICALLALLRGWRRSVGEPRLRSGPTTRPGWSGSPASWRASRASSAGGRADRRAGTITPIDPRRLTGRQTTTRAVRLGASGWSGDERLLPLAMADGLALDPPRHRARQGEHEAHGLVTGVCGRVEHARAAARDHLDAVLTAVVRRRLRHASAAG